MSISPPPSKRVRLTAGPVEHDAGQRLITVYSWNVNGIDSLLQNKIQDFFTGAGGNKPNRPPSLSPLRDFLRRHDWPTFCFLQEVKIRSQDTAMVQRVKRAVSNQADVSLPDYEAYFCLPAKERYASSIKGGKFYGVCSLVRKDFAIDAAIAVRSVEWDVEGRILIVETSAACQLPRLAVINVYLVNGTDLPYRDHLTGEILGTRHDRKLQVHALLQRECRSLEERGFSVIVAGDINVARSQLDGFPRLRESPIQHVYNRQDFEKRFLGTVVRDDGGDDDPDRSLGMFDTFRTLHAKRRGYSYYSRAVPFGKSCDRVDMILASSALYPTCMHAGMHEEPADRGTSDHVPIYATFDFAAITKVNPQLGLKPI